MKLVPMLCGSISVFILATGCASKGAVKPEAVPVAEATPQPEAAAPAPAGKPTQVHYIVKKGDSLWTIAAQPSVMGDSFRWPLLFKANRDEIQDPDLIETQLDLSYSQDYSKDEIDSAVDKAKETPAYVPHSEARKTLPLKY